MKTVTMDFSKKLGPIKPMHSVNNGPAGSRVRGTSNFELYAAAGIPYARNHDASFYSGYGGEHTVDVHRIFKRFEADENDPSSYSFESTDQYTTSIIEAGTKVFYRLGASIEHAQKFGTYPPADFEKWARICEHIIRHYNEGWANGFHYNIEYWEIWNEPECGGSHNPCWQGTEEEFYDLFITSVRHLKSCFPNLKIGGPAVSYWNPEYVRRLLDALSAARLPLDFFSFHAYSRTPGWIADKGRACRELLDEYGYADTEIILNEWNYITGWSGDAWKYSCQMEKRLKGASFTVAAMMLAQDSPIDHFMYYDARPCVMNGLFDTDTLEPLKGYYVFPMFNELYKIGTEAQSAPDDDLYALSAIGENEAAALVTYFADDDRLPDEQLKLSLNNLSDGTWKAACYLLDETHDNELIREEKFTAGNLTAYLPLPAFGTYLVKLTKEA